MEWIAVGTLFAAVVAAVAAIWGTIVSQRQLGLARQALQPPLPFVEASIRSVNGLAAAEWCEIFIQVHNQAGTALDLLSIKLVAPDVGLLSTAAGYDPSNPTLPTLRNPMPEGDVRKSVRSTMRIDANGHGYTIVLAHCPASRFLAEPNSRLILEMRWRDHSVKQFAMTVTIIKPNTA